MLTVGDPVYTFNTQSGIAMPISGRVLEIRSTKDSPKAFDVVLEMDLPWDDGFWPTKFSGKYSPGATLTKGGCEYISIHETYKRHCRLNCYIFTDRIYNLQLCLQQSALFVSNSKFGCEKILKELRSLGQEPPSDVVEIMNRFGLN